MLCKGPFCMFGSPCVILIRLRMTQDMFPFDSRAAKDTNYQQLKLCLLYNILVLLNSSVLDFETYSKFHMKKQI